MLKKIIRRLSFHRFLEAIVQKPVTIILTISLVSVVFAWQIPKLSFKTSVYDLQIDNFPETARYEEFKKMFGSDEIIRIVIKAENVFDDLTFKKISQLSEAVSEIEGVRRVISLPVIKKAIDVSDSWDLEKFFTVVSQVQLFQKNIFSADRKTTALTLVLQNEADLEQIIQSINKLITEIPRNLTLYQIGMPLVSQALAQLTQKDFVYLPPLTFFMIGFVLLILFRRFRYVFIPFTCVGLALIWTFGLMALIKIPLSMLTMIVPVFLIAVGTAYCLHIVSEYIACSNKAESPRDAVLATFAYIYFPTSLAVLTTIIGLGSLLVNRIPAIREFAIFSCFGMLSILVISLSFIPAVLTLIPLPNNPKKESEKSKFILPIIKRIVDCNLNRQRLVLPIIAIFTLICLFGILRLQVETNPVGYFRENTPVKRNFEDIYQVLSGSFPVNIVMGHKESDYFENPEHVAEITRLQTFLEKLPGVDKTISFADYMQLVNFALNQFDPKFYVLPEEGFEVRMVINNFPAMLGQDLFDRFMNTDLSKTNIVLLTHISSSRAFLDLRAKILEFTSQNFSKDINWEVTGFGISISASSHQLTNGQIKSLSITMVLVFAIMFLLFLSSKVGLIAIVPNLFPIIVTFGIMGWLGIELSMVTSLIASIAIGLAVDDTIHYLVRYNKEFQKDLDDKRALKETLTHVGRPIIFTTITISLGFAILFFSSFKPTAVFGIMMIITMFSALVGDLILLPSLMQHVELVTLWDLVRLKLGKEPRYGIPLFKGLSRTQVHYIIIAGALKKYDAGEIIFNKGDPSDSMYTVVSGALAALDPQTDDQSCQLQGSQKIMNRMKKGDILGEMGLLRSVPRSATVMATEPVELLQINWKMIQRLQWLYPPAVQKLLLNLLTGVCDRLEKVSQFLVDIKKTDDATGYYNRENFLAILETELHRAKRYDDDLSLCFIKFTHSVHSNLNYQSQERILQVMCNSMSKIFRVFDTVGRFQAQMFAILMPQTPLEEAQLLCKRLQVDASDELFKNDGMHIKIRLGLSTKKAGEDCDASGLINKAMAAF